MLKLLFLFTILFAVFGQFLFGNNVKIVSLSPNLTEIIVKLNKTQNLVGRCSASDYIPEVKNIPIIGAFGIPDLEKLLSVHPDYVIASSLKDPSIQQIINKLGIKFLLLPDNTIENYYDAVKKLGEILDTKKMAQSEIDRVQKGIAYCRKETEKIPLSKRPTVLWVVWDNPLITVGKKSFINDIIKLAGGSNIAGNINKSYVSVSKEWIVYNSPQVIICPFLSSSRLHDNKNFLNITTIPAVKNNRIYGNLDENILYILGPRILDAISMIHNCLYQDLTGISN